MSISIKYYGAPWCKVCGTVKPVLEKLSSDFDVTFTEYNIDELEDQGGITKVPTVRIYDGTTLLNEITTKHVEAVKEALSSVKKIVLTDDF